MNQSGGYDAKPEQGCMLTHSRLHVAHDTSRGSSVDAAGCAAESERDGGAGEHKEYVGQQR